MEFTIGYLLGAGLPWWQVLLVGGSFFAVVAIIFAVTGKDLS